ncbi:MAG: MOSC domain-containing protein [Planctomycetota bacterium]
MSSGPTAGRIVAVCLGPGGIPKRSVERARVGELGLEGDGHRYRLHGGRDRALCLLSVAEVRALEADGVRVVGPGAFGENLLYEGLDPRDLRPGDRLRVGAEVELELTDVREPCKVLRAIDARFPDLMLGRSGHLARVLRPGAVAAGDALEPVDA